MPVRSRASIGRGWAGSAAAAAIFVSLPVLVSLHGVALAAAPGMSGEKASFPPFDARTFTGQLFWLALTFGALYWLMSRVALPRVGAILHERSATIARDLDGAAQMQAKAEETAQAYEKALAEARGNAQSIAQAARDAGAKASDARRKTVETELAGKLEQAEQAITATKTQAMSNVRGLGSEVAVAIVSRLTGDAPTAAEADAAVDQVLARG